MKEVERPTTSTQIRVLILEIKTRVWCVYVAEYVCVKLGLVNTHNVAEYKNKFWVLEILISIFIIRPPLLLSYFFLGQNLIEKRREK